MPIVMRHATCLILCGGLFSANVHGAGPDMKEGLWEITMKTEMPGMPAGMKPQVVQQCITRKDLEDPRKTAPGSNPQDNRCRVTDYKMQGNTASWNMACTGENAMSGSGTATYSGTSYTGTNRITMKHGGQAQTMTMHYSGRRLGDCKK